MTGETTTALSAEQAARVEAAREANNLLRSGMLTGGPRPTKDEIIWLAEWILSERSAAPPSDWREVAGWGVPDVTDDGSSVLARALRQVADLVAAGWPGLISFSPLAGVHGPAPAPQIQVCADGLEAWRNVLELEDTVWAPWSARHEAVHWPADGTRLFSVLALRAAPEPVPADGGEASAGTGTTTPPVPKLDQTEADHDAYCEYAR